MGTVQNELKSTSFQRSSRIFLSLYLAVRFLFEKEIFKFFLIKNNKKTI